MKECSRPNCTNLARPRDRGLCQKHCKAERKYTPPMPTDLVNAHIERLREAGLGRRRIADLAGVSHSTVRRVRYRKYTVNRVAAKILAVPVPASTINDAAAPYAFVPIVGITRRLQALVAIGYTQAQLAVELGGMEKQVISRLVLGKHPYVWASVARRVDDVYRRLEAEPMPTGYWAERSRERARANGWPPPLAWDHDNIDDPAAKPDVPKPSKRVVPKDFADIVADHRNLRRTDEQIARAMGVQLDAFQKRLKKAGLPRESQLIAS